MTKHIEVAVIGGGQAGLSMSYHLTKQGREHIVFERDNIGESWRSGRWDSFTLVTPNWTMKLPGFAYDGDEPDGYMSRDGIVDYLERYAASFTAPVHAGVRVINVGPGTDGGYFVSTSESDYLAHNVVVATSLFQQAKLPPYSANISPDIVQMHTGQYRNPGALPPGAVLVVGSGQSGCQIAEELHESGRKVYLVVGSAGRAVRRYHGKDSFWWLEKSGFFNVTIDQTPTPKVRYVGNPHMSGKNGGHTINLHRFAEDGVTLLGRIKGAQGDIITFAPDLNATLAKVDEFSIEIIKAIDEAIQKLGLDLPKDPEVRNAEFAAHGPLPETTELNLRDAGITAVIWAMGYKFDFSWVKFPIFDEDGYPIQTRGVTTQPGLYFLGLHFMHTRKSGLFLGVGEDAAHIADHIASRR